MLGTQTSTSPAYTKLTQNVAHVLNKGTEMFAFFVTMFDTKIVNILGIAPNTKCAICTIYVI